MPDPDAPVLCLVGATGTGKSDVAEALGARLRAEMVACDALTVYRRVPLLTATPPPTPGVPQHLVGILEPHESYSAARFSDDADRLVFEIRARGRVPLVVGGTALYLKTWVKGIGPRVGRDPALRAQLHEWAALRGPRALKERLASVDPARAAELHENDVRRLVRAIEIVEGTGRPASTLRQEWNAPDRRPVRIVGLRRAREDLERRITARVASMAERGLLDEVKALDALPHPVSPELSQAIGLPEVREHLAGRLSLEDCLALIARHTRRFSKKQATFFKQFRDATWIDVGADESPEEVAGRIA